MNEAPRALTDRIARLRDDLRGPAADRRRFCVGAAIGTGMAAQSAMRGGADFLLALSAGRMRNMGEPSVAAMLPLAECNQLVMDFAVREILPRAAVPVFFGACAFHPALDLAALVDAIAAAGFAGVANFPTAILIDGDYRRFLEREGLGFGRELDLLDIAKGRGLATLAYTHSIAEALDAAERGPDIVNIDLGWNTGGVLGVESVLRLEEAGLMANTIATAVRAAAPETLCVVEGGPIVNPRQLEEVCQSANLDGYIGGSTIDRVPSESAIEVVTAAFKAIGALRRRLDGLERSRDADSLPLALHGPSPQAEAARATFARLAATDHDVLIVGEPGSGRRDLARALHATSPRRGRNLVTLRARGSEPGRLGLDLFGSKAGAHPRALKHRLGWLEVAHGATVLIEDAEAIERDLQHRLIEAVAARRFSRLGDDAPIPLDVRFVMTAERDLLACEPPIGDRRFAEWIGRFTIALPPLRDRIDDLPAICAVALAQVARRAGTAPKALDPSALRQLAAYHWPGNLRELVAVLERAVLAAPDDGLMPEHLPPLEDAARPRQPATAFQSEKEWVLDGLRRNRYRRGETAQYLGISRKTLYNKMRRYGLTQAAADGESQTKRDSELRHPRA